MADRKLTGKPWHRRLAPVTHRLTPRSPLPVLFRYALQAIAASCSVTERPGRHHTFPVNHLASPAVRDRRAPVAAERLRAQLHARRCLPPLVLGTVDHVDRARHDVLVEAVRGELV